MNKDTKFLDVNGEIVAHQSSLASNNESLNVENTAFDIELVKIGRVVLLQYTVESGNGPFTQSSLAILCETNDANKFSALVVDDVDIDAPLAYYAYLSPPHDEDCAIVRMATRAECDAAGVGYIEHPTSTEELRTQLARARDALSQIVERAFTTYTAKNGRICGIEDDSGEMCYIIPHEPMIAAEEILREAVVNHRLI